MKQCDEASLIYDGECPFCSAYVRFIRFRASVGTVYLIDARDGGPLVQELVAAGIDLNEGMVLKMADRIYHGSDCINVLALLSGEYGFLNRLNAWIFRSPARSALLYPILRAGRNITLKFLNREKLKLQSEPLPPV